jgi:AraC family transcriptional regulator, regulatory protein of adaptative response / DNA-3-methyladenine glycosylase II
VSPLDPDHCYVAVQSRDVRFDGWFVTAVRTTGIYCRPSCPAITPKRANVEFFTTSAAAQERGFRACKRCRPDASPGSPEWNTRHDVVARSMRLIADGVVEREGVSGLAGRLGYSQRHLNRVLTDELGAGPLAVARAQRAHTARVLVETTAMPFTDVAFAAGFGSIRQFNDTVRDVFAASPTALRAARSSGRRAPDTPGRRSSAQGVAVSAPSALTVTLRLPVRQPFAAAETVAFIAGRIIPGVEAWDGGRYRRSLDLPGGQGIVALHAHDDHVAARLELESPADLAPAVQRIRRLLDLDSDPVAVDETLGADPAMAPLIRRCRGRRAPGSVDPFESAVRAIIGQQVSVAGARTVTARLVAAAGSPSTLAGPESGPITMLFPRPEQFVDAPDEAFAMPAARRETIRRLAMAVAEGSVQLHVGVDPAVAHAQLLA